MPLVALDNSWAVCMPKKTGSQSLVGMCEGMAEVRGEWHGCEWDGTGERLIVVREPHERLASMYWWSLKEGNFNHGPPHPDAWLARFAGLLETNKQHDAEWLQTQGEMAAGFRPERVFKLEDGLRVALDYLGVSVSHIQRRNETRGKRTIRLPFGETFGIVPERVQQWLAADAGEWY